VRIGYLSNLSLSDLEDRLDPAMFFRCHRSHIVNLRHVTEIERDGDSLHLVCPKPELARVPSARAPRFASWRNRRFVKEQSSGRGSRGASRGASRNARTRPHGGWRRCRK